MAWGWGTEHGDDARAETFAAVVTGVALAVAVLLPARLAGAALVGTLWGRGLWDVLHLGAPPLVGTDVPPRYPWASLLVKAAGSALYLLFAMPA